MPKKIPPPRCNVTISFPPTGVRIDHSGSAWWVRVRQSTRLGDTWVALCCTDTAEQALAVAESMAKAHDQSSDGWQLRQEPNQ